MTIDELFERRLIFIAGKGGVGKSTVAAALALTAVKRGMRACLVETDGQEQMASLFGTDRAGYKGRMLAPNVRGLSITTEGALREFASTHMPLHGVSHRLINNRLVRYFLDATPGLKELLALGKIVDLVKAGEDDIYVVDLPATGHGRALLTVPNVVMRVVHAGPLRRHAEETHATINNPAVSAVCLVTLAEELAATETVELAASLRSETNIARGPIIANAVHLPLFDSPERSQYDALKRRWKKDPERAPLIDAAELAVARARLNRTYLDILERAFAEKVLVLPFLFTGTVDVGALAHLSEIIAEGGSS